MIAIMIIISIIIIIHSLPHPSWAGLCSCVCTVDSARPWRDVPAPAGCLRQAVLAGPSPGARQQRSRQNVACWIAQMRLHSLPVSTQWSNDRVAGQRLANQSINKSCHH